MFRMMIIMGFLFVWQECIGGKISTLSEGLKLCRDQFFDPDKAICCDGNIQDFPKGLQKLGTILTLFLKPQFSILATTILPEYLFAYTSFKTTVLYTNHHNFTRISFCLHFF